MKRIQTFIAAAVLGITSIATIAEAAAPKEAVLRDKAIVTSSTVTLGDLFINAGDNADAPVSRAPAPGERAAINAAHVANAARAAGMLWPNNERYTHLIVNRDGTPVPVENIREALAQAVALKQAASTPADTTFSVILDETPRGLFVAKNAVPMAIVDDLRLDSRTGLFSAHVRAASKGSKVLQITGRAKQVRRIPVPSAPIARGEIMREDMLTMIDMELGRIAPGTALSMDDLVGMTSRTALRAGNAVRSADLRKPVAVTKDSRVTISFELPGMVLTATGRALEDAPMGGLVRVINTRSHRTVHARVVGPDRVVIESSQPIKLAGRTTN